MFFSFFTDIGRPHRYGKTRHGYISGQKECYDIQRIISKAIEDNDLDNPSMIDTALPGNDFEKLESKLIDMQYLKEPLKWSTEDCSYGYVVTSENSCVFCKKHGSPFLEKSTTEKLIIPKYDQKLEKPFSDAYNKSKERYFKYILFKNGVSGFFLHAFGSILFTLPFLICIGIPITIYVDKLLNR